MNERKRILVCVTGLSPQVVTETVYALAIQRESQWVPDEIWVITTAEGKKRAEQDLLSRGKNWFGRLLEDYDLPPIRFDEEHILTVDDEQGVPLEDIRTPRDNELVADFITETLCALTEDDNTELHVSIAGGRKTMGYYLGYALSLFGRVQDRLSHVLISEPFESSWDFFYPTPYENVIETRNQELADTRTAEVTLAEIPFVRLREELPKKILLQQGRASFSETVNALQKACQPPKLVIDLLAATVEASGQRVQFAPADLAFYAMMARRRKNALEDINYRSEGLLDSYLDEYARLVGPHSGDYEKAEKLGDDLKAWFDERNSRVKKALQNALGNSLAKVYLIHSRGKRPQTNYGLELPPEAIEFADGKLVTQADQGETLKNAS